MSGCRPRLVKIQAEHILEALVAVDPANRTRYEENYTAFLKELDALDAELKALFAGQHGALGSWCFTPPGAISPRRTDWSRCRSKSKARSPNPRSSKS